MTGIECPKTTIADTRQAVIIAFNLSNNPFSSSRWLTGECNNQIGDIEVEHEANTKTGTGFYWLLEDLGLDQQEEVTLRYSLKMRDGYEFVKGGKLPGLTGGTTSCSGGADAAELGCFSS